MERSSAGNVSKGLSNDCVICSVSNRAESLLSTPARPSKRDAFVDFFFVFFEKRNREKLL